MADASQHSIARSPEPENHSKGAPLHARRLLSSRQAAKLYGVSVARLTEAREAGELVAYRRGNAICYLPEDLDAYFLREVVEPGTTGGNAA